MPKPKKFRAELIQDDKTTATSIRIPFNVPEEWGKRGRVPVRGTLNGFAIRSSIFPYGGIRFLVVNKSMREGTHAKAGDILDVVLEIDTEPRVVQTPPDLDAALKAHPEAASYWERLSYTHRKEYVEYIGEAKKPETRARRLEKTMAMLGEGHKEPRG